jgi:hypothetical protein
MYSGPNLEKEGLVFGYDTGYPITNNHIASRHYKGKPVENLIALAGSDTEIERSGTSYPYYSANITSLVQSRWSLTNNVITMAFEGKRDYVAGGTGSGGDGYPRMYVYFTDWSWSRSFGTGAYDWTRVTSTGAMPDPTGKNIYFAIYHMNSGNRGRSYSRKHMVSFDSIATPHIQGTRSSTNALLDLKRTTSIDTTNLSFNSSNHPTFDGTNDRIHSLWPSSLNIDDNTTPRSWEIIVKPSSQSTSGLFGHKAGPGCSYYCNGGLYLLNNRYYFNWYDNATYRWLDSGVTATVGQYAHVVGTFSSNGQPRIYVNGELKGTYSSTNLNYSSGMVYYDVGFNSDNGGQHYFTGDIPVVRFYKNKELSANEIKQNFLTYKNRFNIS